MTASPGLLGAVLSPGALTHTSLALHDAIKAAALPVVELHISNVHAREEVRRHSFVSPAARGVVVGFGVAGYPLAIRGLHDTVRSVEGVPTSATEGGS